MSKPKVGIIISSTRPNRIGPEIANWVKQEISNDKLDYEIIDLAKINLPFLDEPQLPANGNYQEEHTKKWSALISSYAGIIFTLPQYNHGYPATIKNAIDFLYSEWKDKKYTLVSYGFSGGDLSAAGIRQVLDFLKMIETPSTAEIKINNDMFTESGSFKNVAESLKPYLNQIKEIGVELENLILN